jgi:hypothetical protein
MCLIQIPAFLSILLFLIRGRYHDHPYLFWFIIGAAVLASWLWSVVRVGAYVRPKDVRMHEGKPAYSPRVLLWELASPTVAVISVVASVLGIILSFL